MSTDNDRHGVSHAAEGDTVWVLVNHIKPGKVEAHLRWVYDILMPATQRVAPDLYRTVRFLEAQAEDPQEADGTHRTVYIMDPVVAEEVDYQFSTILTQAYGAEQAAIYLQQIEDWKARPQTGYVLKQTVW